MDMEDSSCTGGTLQLYRDLRARGRDEVGVVLQARICAARCRTFARSRT